MNEENRKIPERNTMTSKILKLFGISIVATLLFAGIIATIYYIGEYNTPDQLNYVVNSDQKTCTVTGAKDPTTLVLRIPKEIDGYIVTRIATAAFTENEMQTVIMPNTIEVIGDSAFYGCTNLMQVKGMDECTSLTSIERAAFAYCDRLVSMKLPDNVQIIADHAFYMCRYWRDATIPKNTQQVGSCAYAGCIMIKEVYIPKSVKTIGDAAFVTCEQLTDIIVDEANPYWISVDGVLYDKEMTTLYCYPIGRQEEILTVPEGVEHIYYKAFAVTLHLKEINLPSTIKTIGEETFISVKNANVEKIERLNYAGNIEMWKSIKKPKDWGDNSSNFVIVCTDGQISKDGTVTYK